MNKTIRANICMLITAMIWGSAFVTQRMGMDSMGPIFFVAARSFLGAAVLTIVLITTNKFGLLKEFDDSDKMPESNGFLTPNKKTLLIGGIACGIVFFTASTFQQVGLVSVDAGKSGFLTAMYIIIVPILGLIIKKPIHSNHLVAAIIGVIGLYFLCINGSFSIEAGDMLSIVGAFFWAVHILVIDHFAPKLNPIKLSIAQFIVCGIISIIIGTISGEAFTFQMLWNAKFAIAYTGIMSTAVGFTLQIFAQRDANPTAASIIMSMEALFAVIAGFIFLGERFTSRELLGCLFMLVAVIVAQITFKELSAILKKKTA